MLNITSCNIYHQVQYINISNIPTSAPIFPGHDQSARALNLKTYLQHTHSGRKPPVPRRVPQWSTTAPPSPLCSTNSATCPPPPAPTPVSPCAPATSSTVTVPSPPPLHHLPLPVNASAKGIPDHLAPPPPSLLLCSPTSPPGRNGRPRCT